MYIPYSRLFVKLYNVYTPDFNKQPVLTKISEICDGGHRRTDTLTHLRSTIKGSVLFVIASDNKKSDKRGSLAAFLWKFTLMLHHSQGF